MKLDYSALNRPVTSDDVAAYNTATNNDGRIMWRAGIVTAILLIINFLIVMGAAIGSGEPVTMVLYGLVTSVGIVLVVALYVQGSRMASRARARLYAFARANNLEMLVDEGDPAYAGAIFGAGSSRIVTEAFRFPSGMEVGNYRYTTGHGRSTETHFWGYVSVKLRRHVPNMLLDAKSNNLFGGSSSLPNSFDKDQVLSLEGNFDKYFTLYVPKEYERDALYIFTPDVMSALIRSGGAFDIELIDDNLLLYQRERFNLESQDQYEILFDVLDRIDKELYKQTDSYTDERVAHLKGGAPIGQGRRLARRFIPIPDTNALIAIAVVTLTFVISWLLSSGI